VNSKSKNAKLVAALLRWFAAHARDLPWRRTRDPYAIWVSEIMLQQTQVKTVIPFWNRWLQTLPSIAATANASPDQLHKLWEGLGYYTRVRNLQKAAQVVMAKHGGKFPENFTDILALPGIGRYTAGAISSIAFNQPTPILDGNVIRVLTRLFGISENPKAKTTNAQLWQLAEDLVKDANSSRWGERPREPKFERQRRTAAREDARPTNCSFLNQSLMELGALVCTPRNTQCPICPVKNLCVAFAENRVDELPNLGKRETATARHFMAFVVERDGKFLIRQRPAGAVNAHLWEFPNAETTGAKADAKKIFKAIFGSAPPAVHPLVTVKHSITRYRITLEAFLVRLGGTSYTSPHSKKQSGTRGAHPSESISTTGIWKTPAQMSLLAFTAAHKKLASAAAKSILSGG